jgi:hypothetical protein
VTFRIEDASAVAAILFLAIFLTLGLLWMTFGTQKAREFPIIRKALLCLLVFPLAFLYFAGKMAWLEFHAVSVDPGTGAVQLSFLWPRGTVAVPPTELKAVKLLEMWHLKGGEKRGNYALLLDGPAGFLCQSLPTPELEVVERAADALQKASQAPVSRWSQKGRTGDREQVQQFQARP